MSEYDRTHGKPAVPDAGQLPGRARRRPRCDAEVNLERVLAAAAAAMLREGRNALLHALEYRAYSLLNRILDQIEATDLPASTRPRSSCHAPWRSPTHTGPGSIQGDCSASQSDGVVMPVGLQNYVTGSDLQRRR